MLVFYSTDGLALLSMRKRVSKLVKSSINKKIKNGRQTMKKNF